MNIYILIYLMLVAIFLALTYSIVLKNRGPWNNPILFFIILFMTTWTISVWFSVLSRDGLPYPFISVSFIALIISALLASGKTSVKGQIKMRKVSDRKIINVETKPYESKNRIVPNIYYWVLIAGESLLIMSAYYTERTGINLS